MSDLNTVCDLLKTYLGNNFSITKLKVNDKVEI